MRYLSINSTAISSAIYDENSRTLEVTFQKGSKSYTSLNVPVDTINAFENADSQGSFYAKFIKEQFKY